MSTWIVDHESWIRLSLFVGMLGIFATAQHLAPRRRLIMPWRKRWLNHLALVGFNTLVLRLILPVTAVTVAHFAEQHDWGLFNYPADTLPRSVAIILSIIALDFAIYLQHVMLHAVPLFWRLHRVHHADLDVDVTTGLRFHPLEIILSMLIKFAAILLLGAPAIAVVIFEALLNITSMFNHTNLRLPLKVDRWLRHIVVTPDMHRVHHSMIRNETNSNFGFNLPWWDHLCGTYQDQPHAGHDDMSIGLEDWRNAHEVERLFGMLAMPFQSRTGDYPIGKKRPPRSPHQ